MLADRRRILSKLLRLLSPTKKRFQILVKSSVVGVTRRSVSAKIFIRNPSEFLSIFVKLRVFEPDAQRGVKIRKVCNMPLTAAQLSSRGGQSISNTRR